MKTGCEFKCSLMTNIDKIYPRVFMQEESYGVAVMKRGKVESFGIRMLKPEENKMLEEILKIIIETTS